jgi:hypothetical protein
LLCEKKMLIKKSYKTIVLTTILQVTIFLVSAQKTINTDVLVIGGGASGTAAAIQAARLGVKVVLVENKNWLGGMITAAGVSAFDGNHNMPSGIWAEFREHLYKFYGGPNKVATGWVSNTLFEPRVGDSIFKYMVGQEKNITVLYHTKLTSVIVKNNQVTGANFLNARRLKESQRFTIIAKQTIDATELGEVMLAAKVPFDIGLEASKEIGEDAKVPFTKPIIQDLTYVAILKDYGTVDKTIPRPNNYDSMEFDGCCNEFCSKPEKLTSNVTAKKMLEYGKLPNNKYMINWPGKGNDYYAPILNLSPLQQQAEIQKAKEKTIRFIYFLQTQFGFKNLGLADDEYPTTDKLPLIPYYRESRRLQGVVRFKVQDLAKPFEQVNALYKTGVVVGDYPIDHHHRENTEVPKDLGFYPVPSYNIPIGTLVPKTMRGLIVAEKSISVSNVVNGTTRLQPVVVLIGMAAGTMAAWCVQNNKQPQQINIRAVQEKLLETKAYIMPYYDVRPTHPHFIDIQKIGATGMLKGKGQPNAWANRTWFYPDTTVTTQEAIESITNLLPQVRLGRNSDGEFLTIGRAIALINQLVLNPVIDDKWWNAQQLKNFDINRNITRTEWAVMLNRLYNPFKKEINFLGAYK